MGTITRSFANNITTSGVLLPASLTNNSIANVTAYNASVATGNMVLLSSQTASNSASISFTTGINSTYKEYQFYFINIKPATSASNFTFNGSTDSGSNYNVTKTSSAHRAYHNEGDTYTGLDYSGAGLAQSTAFQNICDGMEALSDSNGSGFLTIFNPSSTTYVKHYISSFNIVEPTPECNIMHVAGYMNTTSAVNAIQFKFGSGNISDGTILMYGIV
jgi:hypothetical protein